MDDAQLLFFSLEVFCAFGLFKNAPTWADLAHYFGVEQAARLLAAFGLLSEMGMIVETEGRYQLVSNYVVFMGEQGRLAPVDYIRLGLRHAADYVAKWFPHSQLSHFESAILSVKRQHWQEQLPKIKDDCLAWQTLLETGDADMLLRFNIQIYPLEEPGR